MSSEMKITLIMIAVVFTLSYLFDMVDQWLY